MVRCGFPGRCASRPIAVPCHNLRFVRKAAEDDLFYGRFYMVHLHFELHNFTVDELAEVL